MRISRKTCFCLLISFVFTVLLVVTIGYRILQSDRVSMPLPLPHAEGTMLKGTEAEADFRFTYRWNLRDCPTDTEILGDLEPPATQQVEGEAIWCIELIAENGKLTLKADPPALQSMSPLCKINARFCITESRPWCFVCPTQPCIRSGISFWRVNWRQTMVSDTPAEPVTCRS